MILSRSLMTLFLTIVCASAQAEKCQSSDDFQLIESSPQWEDNLIEEKTYVNRKVSSKIGSFRLQVTGGVYEEQYVKTDTYTCNNGNGGTSYLYGDKYIHRRGDQSEKATTIQVTFPNDYEMSIHRWDLSGGKYEITFEGLKEHGPFAPKGVLSGPATILKVGEMKLSNEDYATLKKAF